MLLFLLCGIGAYADDVEFDVTSTGDGTTYSGTANVTLKGRTFVKNEWNGVCLPFDASKEVLDAAFGENNYSLQAFDSYADNVIKFKKVTEATAGTPYYIYVKTAVENPRFDNVTFTSDIYPIYSYTNDWRGNVKISDNLTLRGFYFSKYSYELVDQKSVGDGYSAYWLKADETLADFRVWGDGFPEVDASISRYVGIGTYILVTGYKQGTTQKPTIQFEEDDVNSGGGSGESGGDSDDQTSLAYKIKNKLQLTDVPTLYIDIPTIGNTESDLKDKLYKNRKTGEAPYYDAVITVKDNGTDKDDKHLDEFSDDVQIKVRGNSTADPNNDKRAYRLKFPKKHKHDMLGLGYEARNWTLLANVFDHSMIRNALSYHLEKEVGMDFCPGYKFVDLVINGNYRGTYQVCDHVEVDKNRVNIDSDTGWMVEFQGRGDMLDQPLCFEKNGLQMNIKNPEPADEKNEEQVNAVIEPIQDWFLNTWATKWKSSDAYSEKTGWRSVNDEESLIKFWIITELTGDYDGWMTVKAYKEADEAKLHYGPVWDKDLAYGNYTGEKSDVLVSNNSNGSSLVTYINESLLKDPKFTVKAQARLDKLLDGGLIDRLCAKADELAAIVAQTEELNNTKFPRNVQVGGESNNCEEYQTAVNQLKEYLRTRFAKVKDLTDAVEKDANTKIAAVTYNPELTSGNTGFNGWDWASGNMNKLTDAKVEKRSFVANQWNTFCMPFDVTIAQMKSVFGDGVEVVNHIGMDLDAKTMLFAPVIGETLSAGYPYLIKFSGSDVVNPTFTDVVITEVINTDKGNKYNGHYVTLDDKHYFYGTLFTLYNNLDVNTDYEFASDRYESVGSLTKATSGNVVGARAFLRIPDGETPAIKILSAEEAKKFTYDVTNDYVHTAWCQYNNETKDVTLANRGTLWGNEWNMICLPFKLASKDYKKVFGEDVKVAEFTGVTKSEGGEVVSFNLAYIDESKGMKAATPYLIMPSKDIPTDGLAFDGVKVSVKTAEEQASGDESFKLYGTLKPTLLDKGHRQIVLMRNNHLQYMASSSASTKPMQACRAYFEAVSTAEVTSAKSFRFSIDGVATNLKIVNAGVLSNAPDTRVYNLNGQLVGTSTDNLPQGIYVVAGKKVVR